MKFLSKRFLLSALGAFSLSMTAQAQEPVKVMPKADGTAAAPAPVIMKYEDCGAPCGKAPKGCKVEPSCTIIKEACDTGCKDDGCGRSGGFQFGVGIYYIKPFWEDNPSFTTTNSPPVAAVGGATVSSTQEFDHNYKIAPRIFGGYVSESGLGVRLGWWRFDDDVSAATVVTPTTAGSRITTVTAPGIGNVPSNLLPAGTSASIGLNNSIEINVWDLDITQRLLDNDSWKLTVGAGVRYIKLDQEFRGSLNLNGLPGVVSRGFALNRNEFDAAGPNLLIDAKRRLGDSGLGLYTTGRFGVLFGDSRNETVSGTVLSVPGTAPIVTTTAAVTDREDFIPFLDVEAGVEWSGSGNGNLKPIARLGVVGQNYFGVGNGSGTNLNQNLGFFGLTALIGVGF